MDENYKNQIALFRYGIIAPFVQRQTDKGTPQGGNLSPLFANIYLNQLDRELESRGLKLTRYVMMFLICVKSQMAASRVMTSITKWLKDKLRVEVNATKTKVDKPNNIKYLGFSFYKIENSWKPKPHIKSIETFKKKLHDENTNGENRCLYKNKT